MSLHKTIDTIKASQMLTAFISLLRSTLSKQESLITLSDEIETTRKYLVVQKLRYGEKINYELDMQKGTEFCLIPPLILQPVVENAIFHGIEAKNETGTIVIESAIVGDILTITITDDGAGMDSETLQRVRDSLEWPVDKEVRSIGLSNIHHRIRLDFGEAYGLYIESSLGIGTTVKVKIPAKWKKGIHDEGADRR